MASSPSKDIAVVQGRQSERSMAQAKSKLYKIFGLTKMKSKHTESLRHEMQGSMHMAASSKDSASSTGMPKRAKASGAIAASTQQDTKQSQREEEYHSAN